MAIFLIRHGSAGKRNGLDAHDSERDLDLEGMQQADRIAVELAGSGISRILSSPYPRCLQTVRPLGESIGVEVEPAEFLAEGSSIDPVLTFIEQNAADNVVICSHGDVIPELVVTMERRGTDLGRKVGFAKGSIWTLRDWQGHHFATGTYRKVHA
jgi:8-oxo-dGTP diphosphatase